MICQFIFWVLYLSGQCWDRAAENRNVYIIIVFIALNESRRIQLQFATNRVIIGQIRTGDTACQSCATSLCLANDVISLPPVTISFVTIFVLTVEVHL